MKFVRQGSMIMYILFMFLSQGFAEVVKPNKELSIDDCYRLALKQSETIAINNEVIREAEAHFMQTLGALLPQVSFEWAETRQVPRAVYGSFSRRKSIESKFVFKQTLFSGFKEFAGMAGSKLERKQRAGEKRRAEDLLFVDVADAFYLLLEEREDLKTVVMIRKALSDRVAELKERENVGRSRRSEVVNAETQLYNIEAEIELIKSREIIAKELLDFLTGIDIGIISDTEDTPDSLGSREIYFARINLRPDVQVADFALGAAKKAVAVARGDLFPTVTLEKDYYKRNNASAPAEDSWTTLLKVSVPIFEGTTTYGAIKEANAEVCEAELAYSRAKRLAAQDMNDSYTRAYAAILRYQTLEKAVKSAELNYSLQKEDYNKNLVNNLDVLTAIQNFGDTRRNYIHALYEKKRMYWQLQAAAGNIVEDKIK